jgi:hypothetical protein
MKAKGSLPSTKLILGYKDIFNGKFEGERLSFLAGISKIDIIAEIAGLNFRLKGRKSKVVDTNFNTQLKELFYFSGNNDQLYHKYASIIDFKTRGRESFIFSRQACLFALEEITQSDLPIIDGFQMSDNLNSWEALILYILCVNDEVTKIEESKEDDPINFETLNPKLLPIAELMLVSDPFYLVHRGWKLMEFLDQHAETHEHLVAYFNERFNITYERFIFEIHRMWMANKSDREDFNFFYFLRDDEKYKRLFEVMSEKYESTETFKLLNIRKHPFFNCGNDKYILTDLNNLLEKTYQQFTNDFFFDKLKQSQKANGSNFTMQDYKSIIGYFFESYVRELIEHSFSNAKGYFIRMFDELKIKKEDNSAIEAGDIYIRNKNNIILGEVKSSSMYDTEKYGGNIDAMYKNDRNKFFKNFGVDQLANNIKAFDENFKTLDLDLVNRKKIRIWPVIVLNEKAFQTPFMAHIFNARFKELMSDFSSKRIHVYPLTLMHISDLENMEYTLNKKPFLIWEILSDNFRNPTRFIPPLYSTINGMDIRAEYSRIREKVKLLFDKFRDPNQVDD